MMISGLKGLMFQGQIQKIQKEGTEKKSLARVHLPSVSTTHEHPWADCTIPLQR